jgi:hypothetical protein
MADVWNMVRVSGEAAIEMVDHYHVMVLVLASLAVEAEPKPEADRPTSFTEGVSEAEARQRLLTVVEQEISRIGRIRARLQKIAEADGAEAPARLAFETGTEGDRQRRYVLSYEQLVNRKIGTFLNLAKSLAA